MRKTHLHKELKELRCRKQEADGHWEDLLNTLSKNAIPSKSELAYAMERCNTSDYALLIKGYSL